MEAIYTLDIIVFLWGVAIGIYMCVFILGNERERTNKLKNGKR